VLVEVRNDNGDVLVRKTGLETVDRRALSIIEAMIPMGQQTPLEEFVAEDALQQALFTVIAPKRKTPPEDMADKIIGGSDGALAALFAEAMPGMKKAAALAEDMVALSRAPGAVAPTPKAPAQQPTMTPAMIDPTAIYRRD